jgi:hypothetical protein
MSYLVPVPEFCVGDAIATTVLLQGWFNQDYVELGIQLFLRRSCTSTTGVIINFSTQVDINKL